MMEVNDSDNEDLPMGKKGRETLITTKEIR